MALILCSSCNRHIFHPESGGDDACPFCATPVLVARGDSTAAVTASRRAGATVVAALVALSAVPGCGAAPVYGGPITDDEYEDYLEQDAATDGSHDDAVTDGSSDGSGDSDE
jgi:hypothetical protein